MKVPMKIEAVETFLAHTYLLVRIRTESGITGWGQTAYFSYPEAAQQVVERYRRYLLGKDPLEIERHWYALFGRSPFRGADQMGALSAVDLALWDVAGPPLRRPGLPAPRWQAAGPGAPALLDGRLLQRGHRHPGRAGPVRRARGLHRAQARPPPAAPPGAEVRRKVIDETVRRLGAVREAVGWELDIGVEIHRKLVPGDAVALAGYLEPLRPLFYEDPIPPLSMGAHAEVAAKVRIPVAIGERHHTVHEFRDLLATGSIQYVRPDVGLAGGLTHCKKIAALAEAFHAGVITHNFISPLLTAASVQLDAAIPNCTLQEYCMWDEEAPARELLKTPAHARGGLPHPAGGAGAGRRGGRGVPLPVPLRGGGARIAVSGDPRGRWGRTTASLWALPGRGTEGGGA